MIALTPHPVVCCVENLALKVALSCSNVPMCHLLGQQSVSQAPVEFK